MWLYIALRIAKHLAVAALFSGAVGTFVARDMADRRRFAYFVFGPALGTTWVLGFALAAVTDVSILSTWILVSLGLSLLATHGVLYSVGRENRSKVGSALLVFCALVTVVVLMVTKPGN